MSVNSLSAGLVSTPRAGANSTRLCMPKLVNTSLVAATVAVSVPVQVMCRGEKFVCVDSALSFRELVCYGFVDSVCAAAGYSECEVRVGRAEVSSVPDG